MKKVVPGVVYEQITAPEKRDTKLFATKSFDSYSLDSYKEKYPTEYKIAKSIYDAKGIIYDDEYKAVKAITSIKDKTQYNTVQKILRLITGGQGLAQYLTSSDYLSGTLIDVSSHGGQNEDGEQTIKYLNRIIAHLNKIKANPESIRILTKKLNSAVKLWKTLKDYEYTLPPAPNAYGYSWDTWTKRALQDPDFKHVYLNWLTVATSFFGPIGLFLSSGIGLGNAYLYVKEGKRLEAGMATLFALLPGILKVVGRIPLIKTLGEKGMATLGKKIAEKKWSALNRLEIYVIERIFKLAPYLKQDLNEFFKARAKKAITKELARNVGGRPIINQIAKGTLTAADVGLKLGLPYIPYFYAADAWKQTYNKLGLKDTDVETQVDLYYQQRLKGNSDLYQQYLETKKNLTLKSTTIYQYDFDTEKFEPVGTCKDNTIVKFIQISKNKQYAQVKFKEGAYWVKLSAIK